LVNRFFEIDSPGQLKKMDRRKKTKRKDRQQVDDEDWLHRQHLLKQARDARDRASEQMRRRRQTIFVKNWR
jgi:hypothetical protein